MWSRSQKKCINSLAIGIKQVGFSGEIKWGHSHGEIILPTIWNLAGFFCKLVVACKQTNGSKLTTTCFYTNI